MVKGDGVTTGGVRVVNLTPTMAFANVVGVVKTIYGDIPDNWNNSDTSLTSLVIGFSCTSIGLSAFFNCTSLTGYLTIPNTVNTIGVNSFNNSEITGLTIPSSVTTIGIAAFRSCSSMATIHIDSVAASAWASSSGFRSLGDNTALDSGNIYVTADVLADYDSTWKGFVGTLATISEWTSYPNPMT